MINLKSNTSKYIVQVGLLLVAFFCDGLIKGVVPVFNLPSFKASPQFLLLILVMMSLRDAQNTRQLFWESLILGVLYDSYYSHVFGLYTIIFPLTLLIIQRIRFYVPETFIFEWSTYFIVLTLAIVYLYLIGIFLSLASTDVAVFVVNWLAPTLLVNSLFFVILYFPLAKLLNWLI
ncbi:rod shape-determining protein MreD [Bombilactobacillus thymidiniphilus]|uniref:Rod shape-determining protein MreD n=1 Tax=Bombilactobacillus thymidiniphilus TaxID=2923363 RepID=A0ABY4PDG6_9LACO|nr:rod shape-determining protein MreD [Bombilactobacillus thymidiniphilus]UQS83824.1 rod shape-determining protein MreD [Bombilactobacillus thymidiniphilus]